MEYDLAFGNFEINYHQTRELLDESFLSWLFGAQKDNWESLL